MTLVSKTFELYGKTYTFESGELAKQATGACLVKQGDTTMLDTVVVSKERKNYDFFPLTVDFNEKMYAAGRIPGGYLKREGRPSEKATLTARMIDRPIRPSFPDGFRNEVHIVATSLVADQVNPFDVINVMGASLAMTLGGVPFEGPLACVRIGRNVETGEFIVNPTYEERENSDLDLELGGSADFISMVEAGAEEISEDDMLAAMKFGQEALAAFCPGPCCLLPGSGRVRRRVGAGQRRHRQEGVPARPARRGGPGAHLRPLRRDGRCPARRRQAFPHR